MTDQHWNEFLEKLDFVQLTGRWSLLPLHWLDADQPEGLDKEQRELYEELLALPRDLDAGDREEQVHALVRAYRAKLSSRVLALDADLTPPGSRVILRYLDPDNLGQGDCLVTVGSWDRLGHFIAQQAQGDDGGEDLGGSEPSESPVRRDPGKLAYRHLLLFPERGAPAPRAFRALCEKTLRQARGLGARRLTITHLHLPQPGLPDRFAAAELVSAVRQMLRDGGGIHVEIVVLTHSNYEDYRHWFSSLAELARSKADPQESFDASPAPSQEAPNDDPGYQADLAGSLRDFAVKTSSLAEEASRGVSSWFRSVTSAAAARATASTSGSLVRPSAPPLAAAPAIECTFEDQQALNLLYLGRWKEAEAYQSRWQVDSLLGLYLAALHRVVLYLDTHQPSAAAPAVSAETAGKGSGKKKRAKGKGKKHEAEASSLAESEISEENVTSVDETPTPETPEDASAGAPSTEYHDLRTQLLATAETLGSSNPLARYFQLLAWRLDEKRDDVEPDQLEEDHARLLRAAWAWEDSSMLTFLRQLRQDQETGQSNPSHPGYAPVFPSGSRAAPRLD